MTVEFPWPMHIPLMLIPLLLPPTLIQNQLWSQTVGTWTGYKDHCFQGKSKWSSFCWWVCRHIHVMDTWRGSKIWEGSFDLVHLWDHMTTKPNISDWQSHDHKAHHMVIIMTKNVQCTRLMVTYYNRKVLQNNIVTTTEPTVHIERNEN